MTRLLLIVLAVSVAILGGVSASNLFYHIGEPFGVPAPWLVFSSSALSPWSLAFLQKETLKKKVKRKIKWRASRGVHITPSTGKPIDSFLIYASSANFFLISFRICSEIFLFSLRKVRVAS